MKRIKSTHYRWVVAASCFVMIFVCLGFCSSNKSMYLSAITKALNIKRSLFSLNDSFRFISTAIANLFFGQLIMRFGAKKLVGAGFGCMILSTLLYILAEDVITFYAGGCLLGIGMSFCSTTMVSYLVNRWIPEKRGSVTGAILCANGIGGAVAAQLITPMIYHESDLFGYRDAYKMVLVLLVVTGILVTLLIQDAPAPVGVAVKKKKGNQWCGISCRDAMRRPYFYAAAVCVLLTGMSLQGIHGIAAAHMEDVGLDSGYISSVMSVFSLVLACSKFLAGFSYDKFGLKFTLTVCDFFGFAAFTCLAFAGNSGMGKVLAMCYGPLAALALPLETVLVPLIAADLFGEKDFSKLLGIFVSLNTAGYALGTPIANLIFEAVGSYAPILIVFGISMLLIAATFHWILGASARERKQAEQAQLMHHGQ